MSFIGKILVVMQLVLSICLMAFAAAVSTYQTNWKAKSESLEKQLNDQRVKMGEAEKDAKAALDKFNKLEIGLKEEAQQALVRADKSAREVLALSGENTKLRGEAVQKQQLQKDLAVDVINRHDEIKELRGQLKLAHEDRDKEYKAKELLETTIFDLKTDVTRLNTQVRDQLKLNEQYRRVLLAAKLSPEIQDHIALTIPPPKGLAGKVKDVIKSAESGGTLIEISIGENDGLAKGHMLSVYRTGDKVRYLGKAMVQEVRVDTAVCRMVGQAKIQIEKGDDVTTQFIN